MLEASASLRRNNGKAFWGTIAWIICNSYNHCPCTRPANLAECRPLALKRLVRRVGSAVLPWRSHNLVHKVPSIHSLCPSVRLGCQAVVACRVVAAPSVPKQWKSDVRVKSLNPVSERSPLTNFEGKDIESTAMQSARVSQMTGSGSLAQCHAKFQGAAKNYSTLRETSPTH